MLSNREDKAFVELHRAAKRVMRGLNQRIDYSAKEGLPIPVFDGIAHLHSAIRRADKVRFGERGGK